MDDILDQARRYRVDVMYTGRAHYEAADIAAAWNNRLGVPIIVTTAVVGTSIFATLDSNPAVGWKIAAGLISLLGTALAALQTFFKFSEASERHRSAGAAYGALRRQLDLFLLRFAKRETLDQSLALEQLEAIASRVSELATESPRVPEQAYRMAMNQIKAEKGKLHSSIAKVYEDE